MKPSAWIYVRRDTVVIAIAAALAIGLLIGWLAH